MITPSVFSPFAHVVAGFSTMHDCPNDFSSFVTRGKKEKQIYRDHFVTKLFGSSRCAFMNQSHSWIVNQVSDSGIVGNTCDGIWTGKKGCPLVVQVADCVPVLLYVHGEEPIVFAVHSGRRGVAGGIIENLLSILRQRSTRASNIYVAIGPSICQKCYEFGDECFDLFSSEYIVSREGKNYVDVKSQVVDQFLEYGISNTHIEVSPFCSYEEEKLLYSYRREGFSGRRMYGVIGII